METPRPLDAIAQTLQSLDEEVLLAVLDVALDIDGKLAVGERPIHIGSTRTVVRYQILYPVHSVDAMYRYVELRRMGLQFMKTHGFIESFRYHKTGLSGFEGYFEVAVGDPNLVAQLLTKLRVEENRRWPAQKAGTDVRSATARLFGLADSFQRVVLRLRERRANREAVKVKDEYDVQYVFSALLETQFGDVRPEEWTPSYAGRASRVDFFLKDEGVLIETKMTREGLTDGKLGDELIIDIAHYKQRAECNALVCFVYDPEHRLMNPGGLENDLSKVTDNLDVLVLIRPKS
jgi:hypothetical protein